MPYIEAIDDEDFYDDTPTCPRCDDEGTIMVCPDSICVGSGECMHGDGEIVCPVCSGANAF